MAEGGESIVNKQITIDTIVTLATYLRDNKEKYIKLSEEEKERNNELPKEEQIFQYKLNGNPILNYEITFTDNRTIKQEDYNWFIDNIRNPEKIKEIRLSYLLTYFDYSKDKTNSEYKTQRVYISFYKNSVHFDVGGKEMENETNEIYSYIRNIFDSCEDKYDKTIKGKFLRIQSVCFSIGFILSYIVYIILLINKAKLPDMLVDMIRNKYIIVFGQWVIASVLGNVFGRLIIVPLYSNILPERKYSHYNSSSHKSVYVDDIEGYKKDCEVHIDKLANAKQNREKIERMYKVTRKIVLVQLVISILLFLVLK